MRALVLAAVFFALLLGAFAVLPVAADVAKCPDTATIPAPPPECTDPPIPTLIPTPVPQVYKVVLPVVMK